MNDDRWVVLGLARPRAEWFSKLSRWSTAAAIPVDFIKCVSRTEVLARLRGGRPYSALIVGADVVGLDRDLIDSVRLAGATAIVVGKHADRSWEDFGVAAELSETFERSELLSALNDHAPPIARVAAVVRENTHNEQSAWCGQLIAVTGPGGAGSSVFSMAISQAFAAEPSNQGLVLLADLALNADLGMHHDAREVIPGIQEFVDAHRLGRVPVEQMRSLVFDSPERGYHLLLGLRNHRDWTAIRPKSFEVSLEGMLRTYRLVVADITADFEGETDTGSQDIEDRNHMSRTVARKADLVCVVGVGTTKGIHSLTGAIRDLTAFGVRPERIVAVLNRTNRRQVDAINALSVLLNRNGTEGKIGEPILVGSRPDIEDSLRDGVRLPKGAIKTLHKQISTRIDSIQLLNAEVALEPQEHPEAVPVPVAPGSIGHWVDHDG